MKEYLFKTKAITRCYECPFRDGLYCLASDEKPINKYRGVKTRESFCPLVEVQTHGDLIERSSVYKVLDDRVAIYKEVGDEYNACNIACIEGDIVAIPTVIEASKERE